MWESLSKFEFQFSPFVWNSMIIAGSIGVGLVITTIIHLIFTFYMKHSDYFLFKSITNRVRIPANILIPLLTFNAALQLIHIDNHPVANKIMELTLMAAFAFVIIRIVLVFQDMVYHRNDITAANNLKARKIRTQIDFITRILIAFVVVLAIAAMLLSFDNLRKVGTGLLASVGVGSIIIGFAAQNTLSNLLAGFQIAFTQPIRIDDAVIVEGEFGNIEEITLTYVVVKIWDERRLVLPINYFITKPFQNWTRVSTDLLGTVFLYLDYSVPVDKLRQKFDQLLRESKQWDKKVASIQVTDCKERVIEVRALMSARNSGDAFDLRCIVREKLLQYVQQEFPWGLPKTRSEAILEQQKDIAAQS